MKVPALSKLFAIFVVTPATGEPTQKILDLPPCDYKIPPEILGLAKDEKGALTAESALRVFDWISDMDDLAFHAGEGCYARTHLICRRLMAAGIVPQKAWAAPVCGDIHSSLPDGRKISWHYHVAPAVLVSTPFQGSQYLVLDRSTFDGPATIKEWGESLWTPQQSISLRKFGMPPKWYEGDYRPFHRTDAATDEHALETMRLCLHQEAKKPEVFKSHFRQQVMSVKAHELAMSFQRPM